MKLVSYITFFFFTDTETTVIYTLSLHDALPIYGQVQQVAVQPGRPGAVLGRPGRVGQGVQGLDRKSTRLNSSHGYISYAVFCLKKKKRNTQFTLHLSRQSQHHFSNTYNAESAIE